MHTGSYLFGDEILVATSVAHSILHNGISVVVSNDHDIAASFKQLTDNVILKACELKCLYRFGQPIQKKIEALFTLNCERFERFRQDAALKRLEDFWRTDDLRQILVPQPREVVLLRTNDPEHFSRFDFPDDFVRFVIGIEKLLEFPLIRHAMSTIGWEP
jgi:hypothetical protein